jgi:sulfur-oxidizing protein SoxB
LSRLDLDVRSGKVADYRYKLIPVLSGFLPEDPQMAALIKNVRAPYASQLAETLAVSDSLLYRRGHFNGPFDEIILDALMQHYDAQIALSPGFRFGGTLLPGQEITVEDVYQHTGLTYPNTWVRDMSGQEVTMLMEDVADNLFHRDPYYRQGGDMVRVGGLTYTIAPEKKQGERISDIRVGGKPLEAQQQYKAAGWASLREVDGPPAFEVVADYLRRVKRVKVDTRARVRVI